MAVIRKTMLINSLRATLAVIRKAMLINSHKVTLAVIRKTTLISNHKVTLAVIRKAALTNNRKTALAIIRRTGITEDKIFLRLTPDIANRAIRRMVINKIHIIIPHSLNSSMALWRKLKKYMTKPTSSLRCLPL